MSARKCKCRLFRHNVSNTENVRCRIPGALTELERSAHFVLNNPDSPRRNRGLIFIPSSRAPVCCPTRPFMTGGRYVPQSFSSRPEYLHIRFLCISLHSATFDHMAGRVQWPWPAAPSYGSRCFLLLHFVRNSSEISRLGGGVKVESLPQRVNYNVTQIGLQSPIVASLCL